MFRPSLLGTLRGGMALATTVLALTGPTLPRNPVAAARSNACRATTCYFAVNAATLNTVWLYDPVTGSPTAAPSDSYVAGHVFDTTTSALIGDVPNPTTDGHIIASDGTVLGLIAPSPAATAELPLTP